MSGPDAPRAEPAKSSVAGAMTRGAAGDDRHRPLVLSRWRLALLLAGVAVLVTVGVLVARNADRPTVVMRGGLLELHFTTDDQTAQRAVARRCGLAEVAQVTPAQVRYAFPGVQQKDVLGCLRGSSIVRAVALLG